VEWAINRYIVDRFLWVQVAHLSYICLGEYQLLELDIHVLTYYGRFVIIDEDPWLTIDSASARAQALIIDRYGVIMWPVWSLFLWIDYDQALENLTIHILSIYHIGRVLIAWFNNCERGFSSHIANLLNAWCVAQASHTPQSEYLVGWALNRMWQLYIYWDRLILRWWRVQVYSIGTSESFILQSLVGAGRQLAGLSYYSWTYHN
jgi:hypothetical protein